jgi:hypothetical protein
MEGDFPVHRIQKGNHFRNRFDDVTIAIKNLDLVGHRTYLLHRYFPKLLSQLARMRKQRRPDMAFKPSLSIP